MFFSLDNHALRKELGLGIHEMALLLVIYRSSTTMTEWWCIKTKQDLASYLDLSIKDINVAFLKLHTLDYIEFSDDLESKFRCTSFINEIAISNY